MRVAHVGKKLTEPQFRQNSAPSFGAMVPGLQAVQLDCPVLLWNRPLGHTKQRSLSEEFANRPRLQRSQLMEPGIGAILPAMQLQRTKPNKATSVLHMFVD